MSSTLEDLLQLPRDLLEASLLEAVVQEQLQEGFTLEYKRQLDDGDKTLLAIAAMANTFGGVVLVGIDEDRRRGSGFGVPGADGLVGVSTREHSRLVSFCQSKLVPPFDPEVRAVDIGNEKVVLVVRVDADTAPRPVMFQDKVPVRTEAGNRPADRFRLQQLFSEEGAGLASASSLDWLNPIGLSVWHEANPPDLVVRVAATFPLASLPARPYISDHARETLRTGLQSSALTNWLYSAMAPSQHNLYGWRAQGISTSSQFELRWQGIVEEGKFHPESRCVVKLPSGPTGRARGDLECTVDVFLRTSMAQSLRPDLDAVLLLLEALLEFEALILLPNASALAGQATGPPLIIHGWITSRDKPVSSVVNVGLLMPVPGNEVGAGGEFVADADLRLGTSDSRSEQANRWLRQLLLDCHFQQVDIVLSRLRSM